MMCWLGWVIPAMWNCSCVLAPSAQLPLPKMAELTLVVNHNTFRQLSAFFQPSSYPPHDTIPTSSFHCSILLTIFSFSSYTELSLSCKFSIHSLLQP